MKLLLMLIMVTSIYASDLKQRVEGFLIPPQKATIIHINYDPFGTAHSVVQKAFDEKEEEKSLYVASVLNGRVFIDSQWYGVGDKVSGYKIIQINRDGILVKNDKKIMKISIKRIDKIVKIERK